MKGVWPAAPRAVVPRSRLPEQPVLPRVKVLHVITRFIGGSGGNTLISATDMDPERYETWVASMPGGPLWEQAEAAGVRTVRLRHMRERIAPWQDLLAVVELARLMRRERFTVVHTHCSKAGLSGRLAARLAGVPVVVHTFHIFAAHEGLGGLRRRAYLFLDRAVRSLAHRYVAVAPRVAREAVEQRLARPGSAVVVPSAVHLSEIPTTEDPAVRGELGLAADAPVVGTVGRIVAQKCPIDFVRMCAVIHARRPEVQFVMVGDATLESASLEDDTRREAQRLGVPVVFTGFRADAPRIAASFDVYVVPSLYEGLGRAVTEAMASARPVVATAVNGVPDLVEPGSTGLLAEPGNPQSLAEAVLWMLDHPAEAARMARQGRERVRSHFGPAVMSSALDALYSELLGVATTSDVNAAGRVTGSGTTATTMPADGSADPGSRSGNGDVLRSA
jgi:glycosyltransferase involved in cell wall biosynthesis